MHDVTDRIPSEPGIELYVRWLRPQNPLGRGALLMNSRSLCVESSMGIPMGDQSYAEYLCSRGIDVFLIDLRGFGTSTPIAEQRAERTEDVPRPLSYSDYYTDLTAACLWARQQMGPGSELTLVGFSLMATLAAIFAHLRPDLVDHLVCLNPNWLGTDQDPERAAGKFITATGSAVPYAEVSLESIRERLETAQPPGRNFIEPLWWDEATKVLSEQHLSYQGTGGNWRIPKFAPKGWREHLESVGRLKNIRADVLVLHSQYDSENPYHIVKRFFDNFFTFRKYLRIVPNATHLCIWERSRTTVYEWTSEFILL